MDQKMSFTEQWWRKLAKQFTYRGLTQKDLEALSLEKLLSLLTARGRRSLTRGINDNKRKLIEEIKLSKTENRKKTINTHLRDVIVLPNMVGTTVNVFSGKEFVPLNITTEMIGHYLGEYVITNKRVNHGAPGVGASRSSLYVPLKWEICLSVIFHFRISMWLSMSVLQ